MYRRMARLELKVDLILKHLGISPLPLTADFSERVKELARDPAKKIAAIKAYRQETGASLAEAKEVIEEAQGLIPDPGPRDSQLAARNRIGHETARERAGGAVHWSVGRVVRGWRGDDSPGPPGGRVGHPGGARRGRPCETMQGYGLIKVPPGEASLRTSSPPTVKALQAERILQE